MKKENFLILTTALFTSALFAGTTLATPVRAEQESYNLFSVWHQQSPTTTNVQSQNAGFNGNYSWTFAAPEGSVVVVPETEPGFKGDYSWTIAAPEGSVVVAPATETGFNDNYSWTFAAPEGTVVNASETQIISSGSRYGWNWNFAKPTHNDDKSE